ncbi:MAG: ABC-F family ATP-binding cassette domain-containing protein [Ardenticatenaceae bacterium]|nr:ABC-F family ATP-binding cassette domain-containing protein [Ardenticatenaceae bacterium]
MEDLAVGYPGHAPLLTQINLQAQAGERIILTGENGSGKTTLLRAIAGQLTPMAGRVRLGQSVQLGYMSQEQELLGANDTPLSTIQAVARSTRRMPAPFCTTFCSRGMIRCGPMASSATGSGHG